MEGIRLRHRRPCKPAAYRASPGVSGAVLLLPVQVSILGTASPAVTPTNLVFNVAATPGGLLRLWPERRLTGSLTSLLVAGTLPGVIAGAVIRVELLSSSRAFMWVAAGVLLPLGLWLIVGSQRIAPTRPQPTTRASILISVLALLVGCAGGVYGIGRGSLPRQSYWRSASPRTR